MDSLARILRNLPLFIALSLVTNSLYNLNTFHSSITTSLSLSLSLINHSKFNTSEEDPKERKSLWNIKQNTFVDFMESVSGTRRQCFIEEDDGLASLADMEAGVSGSHQHNNHNHNHNHLFLSRTLCYSASYNSRKGSFRNVSVSSPRSGRFYDARFEEPQPHFLEACFLCKKPLGDNRDIFMYRGDTPFCSEECRQEQIETDEAKEKNCNLSSSMKALRKKQQRESTSPNKTQDCRFDTSSMVAAQIYV